MHHVKIGIVLLLLLYTIIHKFKHLHLIIITYPGIVITIRLFIEKAIEKLYHIRNNNFFINYNIPEIGLRSHRPVDMDYGYICLLNSTSRESFHRYRRANTYNVM